MRAVAQTEDVIASVDEEQLDEPTPCAEFDVRTLLGHLVSVIRRVDVVGSGGSAFDVPPVAADVTDDAWLTAFQRARAAMEETWSDEAVLDQVLVLPFGEMPGRAALDGYSMEFTAHGWDLAKAVGAVDRLDPQLAEAVLPKAHRMLAAEGREQLPFDPVVEVPAGAGPYDQLVGWMGRQP
ncbi:MAG: TIGR03086 family protein [Streptosporangiales bacterium]|nr:TIGR03086 family protein [Streptosporangiales bacterium]